MKKLIIATRGSKLALWQSNHIKDLLEKAHPKLKIELKIMKTKGDKIIDTPLAKIGGKGLFTKELEEKVRKMIRDAVDIESQWGRYITQGQILGFTDGIIKQYIQYLGDQRLTAVGYEPEYGVKHPIPWVDGYASFNDQRVNFFEGNVVNYSKGSIDFDDF